MGRGQNPRGNKGRSPVLWYQFEDFVDNNLASRFLERPTWKEMEKYLSWREDLIRRHDIVRTWGYLGKLYLRLQDRWRSRTQPVDPEEGE